MERADTLSERPSKRSKNAKAGPSKTAARLFAPFRALGLVANHVPSSVFVHMPRGALARPTVSIVTSVGRRWMMWDAASMTLIFVGPEAEAEIKSLAQDGSEVLASTGSTVIKSHRGKEVGSYLSSDGADLGQILLFGEQLLALKENGRGLLIWDAHTRELQNEIAFHSSFTATVMLHPATYLNKVLLGSQQGELQLWNNRTCSLVHTFTHPKPASPSPITALVQSPAIDVVGVGYLDGTIRLVDIRQGDLVMQVKMEEGAVTGLAFRMDGPPILASSSAVGSIATWDLSKGGRMLHVHRGAHEQAVAGVEWVAGQPLLISSSVDNTVKQWLYESPEAVPRLLKFRGGHHAPPSCIRYYGDDGKQILTGGRDRALRYTSVVRDSRSYEFSQGSYTKKAVGLNVAVSHFKYPPITSISSSSTRSKDWEDIVTAHVDDATAHTWRAQDKRLGPWALEVEDGIIQAVCVTACGNFGLAGSSTAEIRMWNMQSGKERKSYSLIGPASGDTKLQIGTSSRPKKSRAQAVIRTTQAITGLATDILNTTVIASTLDGKLYFFDFHTTKLLQVLQLTSSITALELHRNSGLLSVTCDDLVIRLVDVEMRRVVRELRGFKGRVLDACFSPDSRWLIATSLDSTIRTFDIPSGRLIDAFRTASIATSITFSPTGDFLATSHVDSLGVHLWANKAQFTDVSLRHINEEDVVPEIGLPSVRGVDDDEDLDEIEPIGAPSQSDIYCSPDQLTEGLLTLSLVSRSRWQTLLNLETIRQRNKPQEPPKAPEKAPFFLPTVSGLETRFDLSANQNEMEATFQRMAASVIESEFTRRLSAAKEEGNFTVFFEHAKTLSPAAIDLEIRSLVSLDHLGFFLHALTARLRSHRDFEAVQALMSVFLAVHGDVLIANAELRDRLAALKDEQRKQSRRLRDLVSYATGTLSFLRSTG